MINFDQLCVSKLGHADERVHGEDCRCQANIELLIAFVLLGLTRSSVAATWFCSASTVEIVRRERRWTSVGATPARELVRSTR